MKIPAISTTIHTFHPIDSSLPVFSCDSITIFLFFSLLFNHAINVNAELVFTVSALCDSNVTTKTALPLKDIHSELSNQVPQV